MLLEDLSLLLTVKISQVLSRNTQFLRFVSAIHQVFHTCTSRIPFSKQYDCLIKKRLILIQTFKMINITCFLLNFETRLFQAEMCRTKRGNHRLCKSQTLVICAPLGRPSWVHKLFNSRTKGWI